jgi:hypothetical protein
MEVSIPRGQCINTEHQYRARNWLIRLQLSLHASVGMTASKIVAQAPFSMIECMIRPFQEEEVLAL